MSYVSNVFERFLEILEVDLESGVCDAHLVEFLGLVLKLLLLALEVFELVCDLGSLDLLALVLLELLSGLNDGLPAEVDQTQVLLEVLLLRVDLGQFLVEGVVVCFL